MTQRTPPLDDADLDLLSAYIDDQLSVAERTALEGRLAQEPDLRQALDELRSTVYVLRTLPQVTPPRSFTLDPSLVSARPWYDWLTPGLLRFGSGLATLLLVVSFLPDLLVGFGRGLGTGMGMGGAPAASAPTAIAAFGGAATAAPEHAGIAAQPTAGTAAQSQLAAPATAPQELSSGSAPASNAPADQGAAAPTLTSGIALPPMAALPPEAQPRSSNDPYRTGQDNLAGGQPIATSGSSSPGTALLERQTQDTAQAPLPVQAQPADPVSPWTMLRIFLALAAVGLGLAAWVIRRDA